MALIRYAPLFLYMHKSKVSHMIRLICHLGCIKVEKIEDDISIRSQNIYNMFCPSYIALRVRRSSKLFNTCTKI